MVKITVYFSLFFSIISFAQGEFVVAIDNETGVYTKFNETPLEGIEFLYPNDATIIESSGTYIFASDQASQDMVFVDIASGTIVASPPLNNTRYFEVDQDNSVLYGLELTPGTNLATPVTIDVPSGVGTPILGSFGAVTYAGNYSDFNQIENRYAFMGIPTEGPGYILYYLNALTGTLISNAQLDIPTEDQITCFKFHRETNVLYAQMRDASEQRYYLITINPITGVTQKIGSGYENASSFASGTIDLSANTFVILYPSPFLNGFAVTTIDLTTGEELFTKLLTLNETGDNFYSIEYDAVQETLYALHYDAEILATETFEGSNEVDVYPNPMEAELFVSKAENSTYVLYNAHGQVIESGSIANTIEIIQVSQVPAGFYYIQIRTNDLVQTKKLMKE